MDKYDSYDAAMERDLEDEAAAAEIASEAAATVYLVRDGALQTVAVFSTQERADEHVTKHDPNGHRAWDVEEAIVDAE